MTHIGISAKEMMSKLGITCWISNRDGRLWAKDHITGREHIATNFEKRLYTQSLNETFETGFDVYRDN